MTASELYEHIQIYGPKLFTTLKDLSLMITAAIGSYVALRGLSTWKRQIAGQSNHTLSKTLLVNIIKYRDAINSIRHPSLLFYEWYTPTDEEVKGMSNEKIIFYCQCKAYEMRWNKIRDCQNDIYANTIEAEALWDEYLASKWKELREVDEELAKEITNFLRLRDPDCTSEEREIIEGNFKHTSNVVFSSKIEKDIFGERVIKHINEIISYLKNKI